MALRCASVAALLAATAAHMGPHRLSFFPTHAVRWATPQEAVEVGASVTVEPRVVGNGEWVRVSVRSGKPYASDTIASFNSKDDPASTTPTEYFVLSEVDPSYLHTGATNVSFRLLNLANGDGYRFLLFTNGTVAAASSDDVNFTAPWEPLGVRLALAAPTSMRVTWQSARDDGEPRVQFWRAGQSGRPSTAPAVSTTYTARDMCGAPANSTGYRWLGYVHSAVLEGLEAGTTYGYTVGDAFGAFSRNMTFTVPPAPGSPHLYPFGLSAVGDMGQFPADGALQLHPDGPADTFPTVPATAALIAADAEAGVIDAHLLIGDISYARGYASEWPSFWDNTGPISERIPFHVNLGNHERDFPGSAPPTGLNSWVNGTDSGGECGVPAANLFIMPMPPGTASNDTQKLWWSAAIGPFFTVHFSTEIDFSTGSPAWSFIKSALASVNRTQTPFVVVGFHRPMYIDSTNYDPDGGDQTVAVLLRQHVEPLFRDAGGQPVDLVIQGHHHSYQRMASVFAGAPCAHSTPFGTDGTVLYSDPACPVHFVIGMGGAGFSTNIQPTLPAYAEFVTFAHGYSRIIAHNATALEWRFLASNGTTLDHAWIVKSHRS